MNKTPGQVAYERDCAECPTYPGGTPRKPWHLLSASDRRTWERIPAPGPYPQEGPEAAWYDTPGPLGWRGAILALLLYVAMTMGWAVLAVLIMRVV